MIHKADEDHSLADQCDDKACSFPTPQEIREELSNEHAPDQKEKAWAEAAEAVKTYHDELVCRWKEEMDTLLVYGGLFSAVLTAFNVQPYQLLQPATSDPTLAILQQISEQLSSFTVSGPFVNATRNGDSLSGTGQPSFQAPVSAVWLNTLWFSSLVFSLASASVALFVKQWLQEATVQGSTQESARLRQYRVDGLLKWRVGAVAVALPIMLQLAAVLFLIGLVVLLWTLHRTVAAVTSSLVAILFVFFLAVVVLPVFQADCSYRSPASFALYAIVRHIRNTTARTLRHISRLICDRPAFLRHGIPSYLLDCLHDFAYTYGRYADYMPTWRGRDQRRIHENVGALDRAIVTTAYTSTSDTRFVSNMPTTFLDLSPKQVAKCFTDICNFEQAHWGEGTRDVGLRKDPTARQFLVMYGLRHMLMRADKGSAAWQEDIHFIYQRFCMPIEAHANQRYGDLAIRTQCHLALVEDRPTRTHFFQSADWILSNIYGEGGAHHTYESLCYVRAMVKQRMGAVPAPCEDFWALKAKVLSIHGVLRSIHHVSSGCAQLSSAQNDTMIAWSRQVLLHIHHSLRELAWTELSVGCVSPTPGDSRSTLAYPHYASGYLVRDVIDPLLDICSTQPGLELQFQQARGAV